MNIENPTDAILNLDKFEYDQTKDRILVYPMFGRSDDDDAPDDLEPYVSIEFDEDGSPLVKRLPHKVVAGTIEIETIKKLYEAVFDEGCETPNDTCEKINNFVTTCFNVLL